MTADEYFHTGELEAQTRWGAEELWEASRRQRLLWDRVPEEFHPRLEEARFFFVATSNARGECDCSFKGGGPGIVRILNDRQLMFPDFPGNGAFMTLGNLLVNPHIGCLFIDFADGARLRINGHAHIQDNGKLLECFKSAPRVVVVDIDQVIPNCAAYVPRLIPASSESDRENQP